MLLTRLRRLGRGPSGSFALAGEAGALLPLSVDADLTEASAEPVEHPRLRAVPVGGPQESRLTAFLDGIQRAAVVGFADHVPVVWAWCAAVIRGRRGRTPVTLRGSAGAYHTEGERIFAPARLLSTDAMADLALGTGEMEDTSPDEEEALPLFPPLLYARAFDAISRWREELERELAGRWCRETASEGGGFLLVDGSLTLSAELAACPRAIGVVKSHRTRFFDGEDARVLLGLAEGERTSIFLPGTRTFTPVYSWYLRLRAPSGAGPLFGLVRVEAPATDTTLGRVDEISRWLLAERSPLALPDGRWDRLLYPVRDCEAFLRARAPSR